ncbi:hypothetical protein JCM10213_008935 [Rhodosporidiobolus nylandii]
MSRLPSFSHRNTPAWALPSPASFSTTPSLSPPVSPANLSPHLRLLAHCHQLELAVRASTTGLLAALSPSQRWAAFLRLGEYRLSLWLEGADDRGAGGNLSREEKVLALPDDAVLCWYAWVLAGAGRGAYEDDCFRLFPVLTKKNKRGERVVRDFPVELLVRRIDEPALQEKGRKAWLRLCGPQPSDALSLLTDPSGVPLTCPCCARSQLAPLLTAPKSGFCESAFAHTCEGCKVPITREVLGLGRLMEELRKGTRPGSGGSGGSGGSREAGRAPGGEGLLAIKHLLASHPSALPFSLNLATSALRLSEFTQALASLGWLKEGWAEQEDGKAALKEAGGRYEKWHTHLLLASQYRDDAIEESLAAGMWDRGRKAWEAAYTTPFSLTPTSSSSPSLLSRLLPTSPSPPLPSSSLTGPSTAPSTHASVLVHLASQAKRRRKRKEGEKPAFLRSAGVGEEGDRVWVLGEEEARKGSGIVGVEGYTSPTAFSTPFYHPQSSDPSVSSPASLAALDEAAQAQARAANEAAQVRFWTR